MRLSMDGLGHADTACECSLLLPAQSSLDYDRLAGIEGNKATKLQRVASAIIQSWSLHITQYPAACQDT